jgi:hypothetical protein
MQEQHGLHVDERTLRRGTHFKLVANWESKIQPQPTSFCICNEDKATLASYYGMEVIRQDEHDSESLKETLECSFGACSGIPCQFEPLIHPHSIFLSPSSLSREGPC